MRSKPEEVQYRESFKESVSVATLGSICLVAAGLLVSREADIHIQTIGIMFFRAGMGFIAAAAINIAALGVIAVMRHYEIWPPEFWYQFDLYATVVSRIIIATSIFFLLIGSIMGILTF